MVTETLERVVAAKDTYVPTGDGRVQRGSGPKTPGGQAIPTCSVCEKVLIAEMRQMYPLFNYSYGFGRNLIKAWMYLSLTKEERTREEDNIIRKCGTCEKVSYRILRAKSRRFNKLYRVIDACLEGILDKFLGEEDKERAFSRDPVHAAMLAKFNPRLYYKDNSFILGVKFDGVITQTYSDADFNPNTIMPVRESVKAALTQLKGMGIKIIVYGWRSNECKGNPAYRNAAIKYLKQQGVPFDFFYDGKGPIIADVFVSNRNLGGDLVAVMPQITEMAGRPEIYLPRRHIIS